MYFVCCQKSHINSERVISWNMIGKTPDNFTLILNFAFAFLVDTIELLASWCQKMGPTPSETEVYSSLWMWKEASKT